MNKHSLTEGSLVKGLFFFVLPLILGQFLQQLYNVADAWVIGNFADNASFAAVSSGGNLAFLIVGFFNGLSLGAGVVISRYYGAKDDDNVEKSIHTTVLFGLLASAFTTVFTSILIPKILVWMNTPENVLPLSLGYFRIYCLGISTIIMYNMFMAIMRAMGDSWKPLFFLCISSVVNIILDLIFVALLHKGVYGASFATVLSQGLSAILCFVSMQKGDPKLHIYKNKLRLHPKRLREIVMQGFPAGIQYSALSLGNVVVQSHINSFGEYAMAGLGAHAKVEGFVFIPIMSMSNALSTFVSQNLGAGQWKRAKKGSIYSIIGTLIVAQIIGIILYKNAYLFLGVFTPNAESLRFGTMFTRRLTIFYMALAFTHAASGILQGLGKSMTAMLTMMSVWGIFRICYVTVALKIRHEFAMICWAYPVTWCITCLIFLVIIVYYFRKKNMASVL